MNMTDIEQSPSLDPRSIDLRRLRAELRVLASESLGLKRRLGQRWTEPMARVQRELIEIRRRTSDLLTLLAWTRGRLHRTKRPRAGSIPDTPWVWIVIPGPSRAIRRIEWTPEAHRDAIVSALYAEYARPSAGREASP